jgi:hypothetical protein
MANKKRTVVVQPSMVEGFACALHTIEGVYQVIELLNGDLHIRANNPINGTHYHYHYAPGNWAYYIETTKD